MANFTIDQLADRWYDRREVTNLAGKYVTALLLKKEAEIFERFWVNAEDSSLTFNEGKYIGGEAVAAYYASVAAITAEKSKFLKQMFASKLADQDNAAIFGVGQLKALPITTPVIEIAGDGKTAKGIWNIQGSDNDITEYGALSYWNIGYLCIDFQKVEDEWKIWHLTYAEDIHCPMGETWVAPMVHEVDPAFAQVAEWKPAPYTVAESSFTAYHTGRRFTAPPKPPVPYETFTDTFSY